MTTLRRPHGHIWMLGGALALIALACSPSDEIVFDSPSVTTAAASEGAPPESSSSTATSTTPSSATTVTPDTNPPITAPGPPPVERSGTATRLPANLVVSDDPSKIIALGTDMVPLLEVSDEEAFLSQPNWSPSGEFVAWSRGVAGSGGSVVVGSIVDGSMEEYPLPYVPFYIQWRPDNASIALLGGVTTSDGGETGLAVLELETGAVTVHHSSRSFYFAWSQDGASMITHMDQARLELYDLDGQSITPLDASTGRYEAAQWTPGGSAFIYVRPASSQSAGGGGLFARQVVTIDEIVVQDAITNEIEIIAQAPAIGAFALAPDGSRIAYNSNVSLNSGGVLNVLDLTTLEVQTLESTVVEPWQWSPDGRHILLMPLNTDDLTLTYRVWTDGELVEYSTNRPTVTFFTRYLRFWGQYTRSHSLWAPDSSGFVFAAVDDGRDLIFYQPLEQNLPALVSVGSMATFTPNGE